MWTPLLAGPAALEALDAARAIGRALRDPDPAWRVGASIANGTAGLAVFYGYLAAADPGAGHEDIAVQFLERAIDAAGSEPMSPSLYHGFPGIAWAMEHALGRTLEASDDDPNADVDAALLELLSARGSASGDYDLLTGLVGQAVYALERAPRPVARTMLELVVARLGELVEHTPDGARWPTPADAFDADLRAEFPDGAYNLGLAHGSPGVIVVLAACAAAGISAEPARALLDDAVRWLLAQELPDDDGRFPALVGPHASPPQPAARLGWCYGDLSVAIALLLAGQLAGRADWQGRGAALARTAAARTFATSRVRDACVCHGSAGLGLMFLRAARLGAPADAPILEAAATRWYTAALAVRDPGRVFGGFAPEMPSGLALGDGAVGVLTGAAGVGLALLAAIAPSEPAWDRVLLLSTNRGP